MTKNVLIRSKHKQILKTVMVRQSSPVDLPVVSVCRLLLVSTLLPVSCFPVCVLLCCDLCFRKSGFKHHLTWKCSGAEVSHTYCSSALASCSGLSSPAASMLNWVAELQSTLDHSVYSSVQTLFASEKHVCVKFARSSRCVFSHYEMGKEFVMGAEPLCRFGVECCGALCHMMCQTCNVL